jgi:type IV secretory pathway VirB2 component (pilin)
MNQANQTATKRPYSFLDALLCIGVTLCIAGFFGVHDRAHLTKIAIKVISVLNGPITKGLLLIPIVASGLQPCNDCRWNRIVERVLIGFLLVYVIASLSALLLSWRGSA